MGWAMGLQKHSPQKAWLIRKHLMSRKACPSKACLIPKKACLYLGLLESLDVSLLRISALSFHFRTRSFHTQALVLSLGGGWKDSRSRLGSGPLPGVDQGDTERDGGMEGFGFTSYSEGELQEWSPGWERLAVMVIREMIYHTAGCMINTIPKLLPPGAVPSASSSDPC